MNATAIPVESIPRLTYQQWLTRSALEQQRFRHLLDALQPEHWDRPTDCTDWTVRDLCGHVLGSLHDNASLVRSLTAWLRASRAARRSGRDPLDELTAAEVRAFSAVPNTEVSATFASLAPRNLRARQHVPSIVRRAPITIDGTRYALGHILSVILTRDLWMHRIDLTRATGLAFTTTPDHDGLIVADLVADWAQRHRQPFTLDLDGPAGGHWRQDTTGPTLHLDAIEYARTLAGRNRAIGLLAEQVQF